MKDMKARNLAWPELDMPRDSHLLSEMSQNLLRAARMPQAKKAVTAPLMEDDKEPGEDEDADGELDTGFIAKRWAVLPKDMEGPEPEFLAKRRKGLPSIHSGATGAMGTSQMRKTKIRKLDTSGNSSVLEVLVPDGQAVDGEIFEDETSPTQAPAPGTVVEGVGVVNAEGLVIAGDQGLPAVIRRRPPPPKRKAKGPGRGRKKKVAFAGADGKPTSGENGIIPDGVPGTENGQVVENGEAADHDHTMGDEGSEDGSEGEESEDGDREEGELSPPTSHPGTPPKPSSPFLTAPLVEEEPVQPSGPQTPPKPSIAIETESTTNTTAGPDVDAMEDVGAQEPTEDPMDEILDQPTVDTGAYQNSEMIDQPEIRDSANGEIVHDSPDEPMLEPISQPMPQSVLENPTELMPAVMDEHVERTADELREEIPGDSAIITEPSASDDFIKSTAELIEEQSNGTVIEPPAESVHDFATDPFLVSGAETVPDLVPDSGPLKSREATPEPQFENAPQLPIESVSQSNLEQTIPSPEQPTLDSIIETTGESVEEVSVEHNEEDVEPSAPQAAPEPVPGPELEPEPESVPEPAIAPGSDLQSEQGTKPDPELKAEAELETQVTSTTSMESGPIESSYIPENNIAAPVAAIQPEPIAEPIPPRSMESLYEPVPEPSERRFSYTRPTTSPKAPTPSPPTPIEDKFSLRAPYVSPKAPTMSPPTPIDRSMLSSPEIPLADQDFHLPPSIDTMQEGELVPVPDMRNIPEAERVSVEAAPEVEPRMNAQIPVDHDPLDGMAEPMIGSDGQADEGSAHFSDGEEDLLGGLERSLNRHGDAP